MFLSGVNEISCESTITTQFMEKGHFSCDDLILEDPEALFFFIKEMKDFTYECISVCHTANGTGTRTSMMGNLMAIATLIISFLCWP